MNDEGVELTEVLVVEEDNEEEDEDEVEDQVEGDVSSEFKMGGLQTWMAIAFRAYKPGDGFLGWAAAKLLGKYGVMHCDIILACPCSEVRCGCDRGPDDAECTSEQPHLRRCTPCRYRDLEAAPRNMFTGQFVRMQNMVHRGQGHVHFVTFTALETGVICRIERDFNYHYFYRVHASAVHINLAEEFLIRQIGAKYNFVGMRCNFIPCLPCLRLCPCGATWDDFDPEMDPETHRITQYSQKIVHWRWFCSELAAATLCHMGLDGFTYETREVGCTTEPCNISPDDLMGMIVERMKKQSRNPSSRMVYSLLNKEDVVRQSPNTNKKTE